MHPPHPPVPTPSPPPPRALAAYNFIDGDSFGIGGLQEFVYGWQAIVNRMSSRNSDERRARAGRQRQALAGVGGSVLLSSHAALAEIWLGGTATYCFGGLAAPPATARARYAFICKGSMYQAGRLSCGSYLRFRRAPESRAAAEHSRESSSYSYCIDQFATIFSPNSTPGAREQPLPLCARGEAVPRAHRDYACGAREREPPAPARRVHFYRSSFDDTPAADDRCLHHDWYGCEAETGGARRPGGRAEPDGPAGLTGGGVHGRDRLPFHHSQLSLWAVYFKTRSDRLRRLRPQSDRPPPPPPAVLSTGGAWKRLSSGTSDADATLHYNTNGVYTPPLARAAVPAHSLAHSL